MQCNIASKDNTYKTHRYILVGINIGKYKLFNENHDIALGSRDVLFFFYVQKVSFGLGFSCI